MTSPSERNVRDQRAAAPSVGRRGGLADEVREVQNPALGAVLLWRAVSAYASRDNPPQGMPIPALYVILPLVLHGPTLRHVLSTQPRSGLHKFAAKFADAKHAQADMLLSVHDRAIVMRALSTEALRIGVSSGLLRLSLGNALAFANTSPVPPDQPQPVKDLVRGAQRLGHWFRPLALNEIAVTLHVRF